MERYVLGFGLQGGGLYIEGTATLTNTNVYSNQAFGVRSLSACFVRVYMRVLLGMCVP